ncbi:hypothetical protein GCM10010094_48750 [Streptomyces flaveus]|uniref:Uncharacterized protein n=1 Tax=Streptomyces flaveus TaxID=66370 RepID=A0A917R0N9_9ACTN|nr:hypothetical protein GCM10010094_48750 [Streptomyces flaveus]
MRLHTGCERSARIRAVRALLRRVSGRLTELPRKEAGRAAGSPSYSAVARLRAARPAACPTLRGLGGRCRVHWVEQGD